MIKVGSMRISVTHSLLLGALALGCGGPGAAHSPEGSSAEEMEAFDPSEESKEQPFSAHNELRGSGLHINGLRLSSTGGSFRAMVSSYEGDSSIVFLMMETEETPQDWLDACPRSVEDPKAPVLKVQLLGVGDISQNAMMQGDNWSTSISAERYAELSTLQFRICGTEYKLDDKYKERLARHAQVATEEAIAANREERTAKETDCTEGDTSSCLFAASMMRRGEGGPRDPEGALAIYEKLCDQGNDGACLGVSRVLTESPTPELTQEAEVRYQEAASFAARACELAGMAAGNSCFQAARLYASGFGVPADAKRVKQFVEASCAKRFPGACENKDRIVSCAQGQSTACAELAAATAASTAHQEVQQGELWSLAACKNGDASHCAQ